MQKNTSDILKENVITLREEKYAKVKIAILNETLAQLEHTDFDNIIITDLCRKTGISKRTFFNYFPLKSHIILYLLQIWIIEITTNAYKTHGLSAGLELIYTGFEQFGQKMIQHPTIILEMIKNVFNKEIEKSYIKKITLAEEILLSLDLSLITEVPSLGFDNLLHTAIKNEIKLGTFSKEISINSIEISMSSILLGVPLSLDKSELHRITEVYKEQLDIFWKGYMVSHGLQKGEFI